MTALLPAPGNEVVEASDADLKSSLAASLKRSGFTFEELARQAQDDDFETVGARMAWVAIGDLGSFSK